MSRFGAFQYNKSQKDIKYSLTEDSKGNKLTKEQQEFFKDSKVRDSDGKLMEVYHGRNLMFSKLRLSNGIFLWEGFYFSI